MHAIIETVARRVIWELVLVAIAALALWYAADVFLLAFAGILLAVFLSALTDWVRPRLHVSRGGAFALVVVVLAALVAGCLWWIAPRLAAQLNQLVKSLPAALTDLQTWLETAPWGRTLVRYAPDLLRSPMSYLGSIATRSAEAVAGLVVIVVVGLYVGADPELYNRGLERLVPPAHRRRSREVLSEVAYTLRWWILGQMVPMVVLGVASLIALELMKIPLAFSLALITAVLIFIPYIGSVIAAMLAGLVALMQGPVQAFWVVVLFTGIHIAEGYFLTPLVQKRAVLLPPALTILAQVFMLLILGFLGLALATPLTAAALAAVKIIYLGEDPPDH